MHAPVIPSLYAAVSVHPKELVVTLQKFNNFLAIHSLLIQVLEQGIQIKIEAKILEGRCLVVVLKL
jgi:hypothetical protein